VFIDIQEYMRQARGNLTEVYMMLTGKVDTEPSYLYEKVTSGHDLQGHTVKLHKHPCRLQVQKHFFTQRIANDWNCLPQKVVDATCINIFKRSLDKYYQDMYISVFYGHNSLTMTKQKFLVMPPRKTAHIQDRH